MQRAPVQRSSSPSLLEERNQQLETNLRFVVQQLSQRAEDAVMERLDALLARKERDLRHALLRAQARDLSPTERLEERVGVLERTFAAAVALLGQADDAPAQAAAAPASSAASPFSPHPWDSRGAPYASPAPPPQTPPSAAARSSSREAELAKQVEVLTAEAGRLKAEVAEATAAADKARAEAARRVHAAEEEASISKAAAAAAAARSRDLEEAVEAARAKTRRHILASHSRISTGAREGAYSAAFLPYPAAFASLGLTRCSECTAQHRPPPPSSRWRLRRPARRSGMLGCRQRWRRRAPRSRRRRPRRCRRGSSCPKRLRRATRCGAPPAPLVVPPHLTPPVAYAGVQQQQRQRER